MKHSLLFAVALSFVLAANAQVADILGDWLTVDDKTGDSFSVVNIYKDSDGKYYGKIP